jgi:signal transduction histidine kinase
MKSTRPRRGLSTCNCQIGLAIGHGLLVMALLGILVTPRSQAQTRKNVLMIMEAGLSHPGIQMVTNEIMAGLRSDPRFQVEIYWENLDALYHPDAWQEDQGATILRKYANSKIDLIVLTGPHAIRLLTSPSKNVFPGVPAVFCCSPPIPIDPSAQNSRITGSWQKLEPSGTVDIAIRLLPETRHVFVVAGQSGYDLQITKLVKESLNPYEKKLDISYLTDLPWDLLLNKVGHLPSHSVVLFDSYFKDPQGREFLGAIDALPAVSAAANAPVFGLSDTYVGNGAIGGLVTSFQEQGRVTAGHALAILAGKPPHEIPIEPVPAVYMFDWRQFQRWKLDRNRLPASTRILFYQPSIWELHRQLFINALSLIFCLSVLTTYLLHERRKLRRAQTAQNRLSGALINAQEDERSRVAAELHDDFSQRLAVLALGLGTAADAIPDSPRDAERKLRELSSEVSSLGGDLHTLSHRLHSATLERLGLSKAVSGFCKEFEAQHGFSIDCNVRDIPRSLNPDVALCIFRLVQESLRNAKKHSGASSAEVTLSANGDTISLLVSDSGTGFNPKKLGSCEGLGVRNMEERARLMGGRFEIRSKPGQGTVIDVHLPISPESRLVRPII